MTCKWFKCRFNFTIMLITQAGCHYGMGRHFMYIEHQNQIQTLKVRLIQSAFFHIIFWGYISNKNEADLVSLYVSNHLQSGD
jgi:hypothetical protein